MNAQSSWGKSPRESIEEECARRGKDAFVSGCIELLEGREADADLIVALGGPPARWAGTGDRGGPDYWLRVWAARGLLWVWDDAAGALTVRQRDVAARTRTNGEDRPLDEEAGEVAHYLPPSPFRGRE